MPLHDDARLRELVLYIARRCDSDPYFGAVKLNKILFNADFAAYAQRRQPITEQEYQKLENGPAPRGILSALEGLQQEGALRVEPREVGMYKQQRAVALRGANLSLLAPEEIDFVDKAIDEQWGKTAKQVSDESHEFLGWKAVGYNSTIPYETVFVDDSPLSEEEILYGQQVARELAAGRSTQ